MVDDKQGPNPIEDLMTLNLIDNEAAFIFFGWAGVLLKTKGKIVAFDLSECCVKKENIPKITKLDLQVNGHIHLDHFDLNATTQLFNQTGAKIVVEPEIYDVFDDEVPKSAVYNALPDKILDIDDFQITSIKGIHPCPITLFHVKWNSFSVFHGGDSDYVPLDKYQADLALIPTGSPSPSCSPEKGLKMVLDVKPSVVVATHGTNSQMNKFKSLVVKELPETKVVVPEKNKIMKIMIN